MFVEPAKHRRSEARRVAMFVEGCLTTNMSALRAYGWFGILWLQTCRPYGPLNGGVWLVLQTCQPYGPLNGVFGWLQTCRPYGPMNGVFGWPTNMPALRAYDRIGILRLQIVGPTGLMALAPTEPHRGGIFVAFGKKKHDSEIFFVRKQDFFSSCKDDTLTLNP